MPIEYLFCEWSKYKSQLMAIRRDVFIQEQGVPEELEIDEWDAKSTHLLVLNNLQPIATARLLPNGHIGRMCVTKPFRGQGIGKTMLERLIHKAALLGIETVKLNAQVSAIGFYQKSGFQVCSDTFMDAGIEHKSMSLDLKEDTITLSNNPLLIDIDNKALAQEAVVKLISKARHQISILSQQLEPELYNQTQLCEHISQLIRHNHRCKIRILYKNNESIGSQSHCLIQLAQRFSSFIEIRLITHKEFIKFQQSWLLIDDMAYCHLKNPARYIGEACFYNKLVVKEDLEFFNQAWEHSEVDPLTRRLSL